MVGFQSSQPAAVPDRRPRQPTSTSRSSDKQPAQLRRADNVLRHPASQLPTVRASPSSSRALINGHEGAFPPTPPFNSRESVPQASEHLSNGSSTPIARRVQDPTSTSQRSPPTPARTPPAPLSPPQRLIPSRTSGSIADSFKTAREDPWNSADDVSTIPDVASLSIREVASLDRDLSLGFEEDVDHTPTQSMANFPSSAYNEESPIVNDMDHVPNREWDTNLMRNVTVRRKRIHPKPHTNGVTPSHQPVKPVSSIVPDNNQPDSPVTPRAETFRINHFPSRRRTSNESHSQDELATRRFSGVSNASTIVEAIIISTPPPKPRKLRHVSKTLSLRSDADSDHTSPRALSARGSIDSSDQPLHRTSQRLHTVDRRLPSSVSDGRMRVSTDPLLRHQRDSYSLREDAEMSANRIRSPNTSLKRRSISAQLPSPLKTSASHDRKISTELSPLGSPTSTSYSISSTDHNSKRNKHGTRDSTRSPSYHSIRNSTQQALQNALGPVVATFPSSTNDSLVTVVKRDSGNLGSANGPMNNIVANNQDPLSDPVQNEIVADSESRLAPPLVSNWSSTGNTGGLDRRLSDASGKSFDRSEFSARRSIDRSTVRSEDHPRLLYSQNTPFSQISARDALEVSEATAVNIYPHNNHSLLVVEQGKGSQLENGNDGQNLINTHPEPPVFSLQPSTPPIKSVELEVDSPLKNPRKPPNPPKINILPATPAQDEKDPLHEAGSSIPQRRGSLLQRARRYSDNIMQPILSRSTSLRRRNSDRPRHKREETSASHLHPFWHPRDFWEDVSDSDSEFGDGEDGYDRLPPGGDTSELPPPSLPRRLTQKLPGFRGTGGFLIGNSLGLNRHGTNVRRHHISLPSNFKPNLPLDSTSPPSSHPYDATSTPMSRRMGSNGSLASLRSVEAHKRRMHRQWKTLGLHIEYVGIGGVRELWRDRREKVREQKAEKRRDKIRRSIGPKFLIENGAAIGAPQ